MGTGVEEHRAAEVRDTQRCEVLLPTAEPTLPAAVQDEDINLPVLAAICRLIDTPDEINY